jgi:DNA-binding NarL/FixJ family response regulator
VRTKVSQQGIARATILLKCSYPLVTLGLKQVLGAAGYEICSIQKGPATEQKPPALALYVLNDKDVGEDVAQEVKSLQDLVHDASVVVLSLEGNLPLAHAALRAGACGFLHLGMQPSQITRALLVACQGEVLLPRDMIRNLIGEGPLSELLLTLTARQKEILELVGEGLTNAEIARRLFLAEGTVKQHLRGVYKVLNVRSRVQAAALLRAHN